MTDTYEGELLICAAKGAGRDFGVRLKNLLPVFYALFQYDYEPEYTFYRARLVYMRPNHEVRVLRLIGRAHADVIHYMSIIPFKQPAVHVMKSSNDFEIIEYGETEHEVTVELLKMSQSLGEWIVRS